MNDKYIDFKTAQGSRVRHFYPALVSSDWDKDGNPTAVRKTATHFCSAEAAKSRYGECFVSLFVGDNPITVVVEAKG